MLQSPVSAQTSSSWSLEGVFAAVLTPCHPDLSCNVGAMADHCNDLINRGCSGVLVFGTTGEGASFSLREKKEVIGALADKGVDPKKMLVGVASCSIEDAADLSLEAIRLGCPAVLMTPPFYYSNVDDAGIAAFYQEVILRVNDPQLKIILYHIPQLTGVSITIDLIRILRGQFPDHVIGIKESEGNMELIRGILTEFKNFSLFAGSEVQISDAVRLGASGGIVGMANVFPELICSLHACGLDPTSADHNERARAIRQTMRQFPVIPALKSTLQRKKGGIWSSVRPPFRPLSDDESNRLAEMLDGVSERGI